MTLFTATVEPIFEKIWFNQNENEKLSSLRDITTKTYVRRT